ELPRERDLLFDVAQIASEAHEILGSMQLRVSLGHGEYVAERLRQQVVRGAGLTRAAGLLQCGARARDLLVDLSFVLGVPAHGFDQIRNEARTLAELHV